MKSDEIFLSRSSIFGDLNYTKYGVIQLPRGQRRIIMQSKGEEFWAYQFHPRPYISLINYSAILQLIINLCCFKHAATVLFGNFIDLVRKCGRVTKPVRINFTIGRSVRDFHDSSADFCKDTLYESDADCRTSTTLCSLLLSTREMA